MNTIRTTLLLLAGLTAVVALPGCGRDEPAAAVIEPAARDLLSYVPADTPYLAANLAALPDEIIDLQFQRFAPVTAEAQKLLDDLRGELESSAGSDADRLALAVLAEVDGKLSRAGLESLGLDMRAAQAIYGMGAFPVARVGLSDAGALRATVERVLANAGVTADPRRLGEIDYWYAPLEADGDLPLALYAAILPTHLVVGLLPPAAEGDLLPALLGIERPATSDAAERLAALNARHGFTPYMTFTLDTHRLADEFIATDSATLRALGAAGSAELAGMDAVCAEEIHGILDKVPAVTVGVSELEASATAVRGVVEMPDSLGSRLVQLAAEVPAIAAVTDRMAEFAFGIRIGAARDFLREELQAILDTPYRCEQLADLNTQAGEAMEQLDRPLPPFVNNFRGVNFSLESLEMADDTMIPREVRGHLAVQVENPQMVVGIAQMMLPDLSEMQLAPGDEPVRVPEYLGTFQNIVAYAALSDDAIGVSLGEGEQQGLAAYLARKPAAPGLLLAADYDSAAWYRMQRRDLDEMLGEGGGANPFIALADVISETMERINDRHRVEVRVTPTGLVFDSRYTYR